MRASSSRFGRAVGGVSGAAFVFISAWLGCVASHAEDENLLANPGFEMLTPDGTPEDWDLFVMPMEGALGRVSSQAASGDRSISLYTPSHYPLDPANNWSQVVYGDFGGKRLRASVWVRSEDVGGAALWIQCFRRAPVRVLATATSASENPVTGTTDWTEISTTIEAPEATSYVVIRCVIRETGRVWFDDVELTVLPPTDSGFVATAEEQKPLEPTLAEEFGRVRREMQETLASLQDSTEALRTQVSALQAEISELRSELNGQTAASAESAAADELEMARREIQVTLDEQAATNEGLREEIAYLEEELDDLQALSRETPTVALTTPAAEEPAPQAAEEFDRLRAEVQAALDGREQSTAGLGADIAAIKAQLDAVEAQLRALGRESAQTGDAELPPAIAVDLDAVRDQMLELASARDASDRALRDEIATLAAALTGLQNEMAELARSPVVEPPPTDTEPLVREFESMRSQIQSTLDDVRASNEGLRDRLETMQGELQQLRGQLDDVEAVTEDLEPAGTSEVRHILVPRNRENRP